MNHVETLQCNVSTIAHEKLHAHITACLPSDYNCNVSTIAHEKLQQQFIQNYILYGTCNVP